LILKNTTSGIDPRLWKPPEEPVKKFGEKTGIARIIRFQTFRWVDYGRIVWISLGLIRHITRNGQTGP
jgi:hypothetical protein